MSISHASNLPLSDVLIQNPKLDYQITSELSNNSNYLILWVNSVHDTYRLQKDRSTKNLPCDLDNRKEGLLVSSNYMWGSRYATR